MRQVVPRRSINNRYQRHLSAESQNQRNKEALPRKRRETAINSGHFSAQKNFCLFYMLLLEWSSMQCVS
jgi:hypothetical protein